MSGRDVALWSLAIFVIFTVAGIAVGIALELRRGDDPPDLPPPPRL